MKWLASTFFTISASQFVECAHIAYSGELDPVLIILPVTMAVLALYASYRVSWQG